MKADYPKVKVCIDKSKQRKSDGLYPLFVGVQWQCTRAKETANLFMSIKDYEKGAYLKNRTLSKRLADINIRITELLDSGEKFTAIDVLQKVKEKTPHQLINELSSVKKLSYNTHRGYMNMLVALQRYFGADFKLSELTLNNIQSFCRTVRVKPSTIWSYIKCLKALLTYAQEKGYVKENVIRKWRFKADGYHCTDKPKSRSRYEVNEFISLYKKTDDANLKEALGIWLSGYFFCGLALVDIMNINWDKVGEKWIEGSYYYCFEIYRKKTKEVARITTPKTPLTEELLNLLRRKPWTGKKNYYTIYINKQLKKANPTLTYYSCRHTFATQMVNSRTPLNTIAALLGRNVNGLSVYIQRITEQEKLAKATSSLIDEEISIDPTTEAEVFDKLV